jgi:hypothetical protein
MTPEEIAAIENMIRQKRVCYTYYSKTWIEALEWVLKLQKKE